MDTAIRIAIIGYGNIGRGVRLAIEKNADMKLAGIFSRSPDRVRAEVSAIPVFHSEDYGALAQADIAILCGGSKDDLPVQGPKYVQYIHTIDSYDNHSQLPAYFKSMDDASRKAGKLSLISIGWDPGTFSLERVIGNAIIPGAKTYGFYGLSEKGGLSMGHSDALRQVPGIKDARQYTHAIPEAIDRVRSGENPDLAPGDMHWRECFVVTEEGANREAIAAEIRSMPGYFAPYRTEVHFVSKEELERACPGFPHDGLVIGSGFTGSGNRALVEYRNVWGSNPEATAHILVASARAAMRLVADRKTGAHTLLDVPPAYLSPLEREELISRFV